MPLYQYTCKNCESDIERIVNYVDSNKQSCKKCGERLLKYFPNPSKIIISDALYDNSTDVAKGMAGKPYKGHYYKEDNDAHMG